MYECNKIIKNNAIEKCAIKMIKMLKCTKLMTEFQKIINGRIEKKLWINKDEINKKKKCGNRKKVSVHYLKKVKTEDVKRKK